MRQPEIQWSASASSSCPSSIAFFSTRKSPNLTGSSLSSAIVSPCVRDDAPTYTYLCPRCQVLATSSVKEYAAQPMPPLKSPPRRPRRAVEPQGARVRRGTVRVPADVAQRLRAGHPYLFRDALGGRPMRESAGDLVELVDPAGEFVARGLY